MLLMQICAVSYSGNLTALPLSKCALSDGIVIPVPSPGCFTHLHTLAPRSFPHMNTHHSKHETDCVPPVVDRAVFRMQEKIRGPSTALRELSVQCLVVRSRFCNSVEFINGLWLFFVLCENNESPASVYHDQLKAARNGSGTGYFHLKNRKDRFQSKDRGPFAP